MNKQETKQIETAKTYIAHGMIDTAARSVSALIRSAMTNKSKTALMQFATDNKLISNPEFIV
jgi:hypothetical protein